MKEVAYNDYVKMMRDWMNGGILDIKKILNIVEKLEKYDA